MPVENVTPNDRSILTSTMRGMLCKCPACGEGKVFDGFLNIKANCEVCGEDLSQHRADDLPAYLNIFLVGHIVVGFMAFMMTFKLVDMWTMMALTILLCIASAFFLMRPLKGMVLGNQWALRMHGFGGDND